MKPALIALVLLSALFTACRQPSSPQAEHTKMLEQQLAWHGIADPQIIRAFQLVPREPFVLPEYQDRAYEDLEVPIGEGQTLDRPYQDALMLHELALKPTDRVLEVGTGTGYLSSLMGKLAQEVYTIEIRNTLANKAQATLERLKYANIHVRAGDGFKGWKEAAPFDAMILSCSPDDVPPPLVEQLREGGRMVLPQGGEKKFQELLLYSKEGGKLKLVKHLKGANFVPMEGLVKEQHP